MITVPIYLRYLIKIVRRLRILLWYRLRHVLQLRCWRNGRRSLHLLCLLSFYSAHILTYLFLRLSLFCRLHDQIGPLRYKVLRQTEIVNLRWRCWGTIHLQASFLICIILGTPLCLACILERILVGGGGVVPLWLEQLVDELLEKGELLDYISVVDNADEVVVVFDEKAFLGLGELDALLWTSPFA